jgi:hypothetical protein
MSLDGSWFMARHYGTHWVGWGYAHPTQEGAVKAFAKEQKHV